MVQLAKKNGSEERRAAQKTAKEATDRREAAVRRSIEAQKEAIFVMERKRAERVRQVEIDKILQRIEDRAHNGYRYAEYALCGREWAYRGDNPAYTSMNDADPSVEVTTRQTEQVVKYLKDRGLSVKFELSNCDHFWSFILYKMHVDLTIRW